MPGNITILLFQPLLLHCINIILINRVEEVKGDESINSETNTDIMRIQAEIERLTSEAESAAEK